MVEDFAKMKKELKKKENKEYKKIISSKMSYKSGNPLKGLLKVNRPTIKVSAKKEDINLMRATW
jgi:hypothetical protein